MKQIIDRLKRLETTAKQKTAILYPDDSDGFVEAVVGDRAERFRHGSGFDALAAISSTAADDWSEYR